MYTGVQYSFLSPRGVHQIWFINCIVISELEERLNKLNRGYGRLKRYLNQISRDEN